MKFKIVILSLLLTANAFAKDVKEEAGNNQSKIQFALALDTSGSMQGLINQARSRIWSLLNALEGVTKNGKAPQVEVALLEFGKSSISKEEGHMRIISDFTLEHTNVSSELFSLVTNGGDEFVPQVIQLASGELDWSDKDADFKALFVSGNESPTQGTVTVDDALAFAEQQGVLVNLVHAQGGGLSSFPVLCPGTFLPAPCPPGHANPRPNPNPTPGPIVTAENEQWRAVAEQSGGSFATIEVNSSTVHIESPFDDRIVELTKSLNKTYLPYGENGQAEYDKLLDLDNNVGGSVSDYIDWGGYRSGPLFNPSAWDLVSAIDNPSFDLKAVDAKYLPEVLKDMSYEERKAFILIVNLKRKELQKEINDLRAKREEFVQAELDRLDQENQNSLGEAMISSLYKQLTEKGFAVPAK